MLKTEGPKTKPELSVIIPTLNEERQIGSCIQSLRKQSDFPPKEIIVVDGGSEDRTMEFAHAAGAIVLKTNRPGRARQLNLGAREASSPVYFFLHADARPPVGYLNYIDEALSDGCDFGCFAYRFDRASLLMKINSYLTKYDGLLAGGGDQGLFVRTDLFEEVGGYDESHIVMEDFELYRRLKSSGEGAILPQRLTVSARKYRRNGYLRVQFANLLVFSMYHIGVKQTTLAATYHSLLK